MASLGVINASTPSTRSSMETTERPMRIYFGVFFDGTGNNMVQAAAAEKYRKRMQIDENDNYWDLRVNHDLNKFGANDLPIKPLDNKYGELLTDDIMKDIPTRGSGYSNVAILHAVYQSMSDGECKAMQAKYDVHRYNIYVEGAGTEAVNNDSITQDASNLLGSGFGNGDTGVVALVSKAVVMVNSIARGFQSSRPELHFDVFGFSRGATCARLFSFLVARDKETTMGAEDKFNKFQASPLFKDGKLHFLEEEEFSNKTVDFLGIYDTVSSIGITYTNNVKDFGLYSPTMEKVKNTFHLCALDEFRDHFAVTDIGRAANDNNAEIFIPGCHTDVGGGYTLSGEKFTLLYQPTIFNKTKWYVNMPHSKSGGTIDELSATSLISLGWANSKSDTYTNWSTGYITCTRKRVLGGYSNIPLRMMAKRAIKKTSLEKFSTFPAGRFDIPKMISTLGSSMISIAESATRRSFYYPGGSFSSTDYRKLRQAFLHFSATDALGTSAVNGPSRCGFTIARIVYSGNPEGPKPKYLFDYA